MLSKKILENYLFDKLPAFANAPNSIVAVIIIIDSPILVKQLAIADNW